MAAVNKTATSSIAMALAGRTASMDIPKPRGGDYFAGRDSFAAVAGRSVATSKNGAMNTNPLPTPPNSISPNLPPLGFKRQHLHARHDAASTSPPQDEEHAFAPMQVDSDIDLHDDGGKAAGTQQPQHRLDIAGTHGGVSGAATAAANADAAGAITPGLLAKHHLPEILLAHGPLAIRHVMAYLTTSVPGFSGIPPAKARRLVVGALEGRGSGGEGGGVDGKVEFEKVGWGRWDARVKGHAPRDTRGAHPHQQASPPTAHHSSNGIAISKGPSRWPGRATSAAMLHPPRYPTQSSSWAGDSAVFSHGSDGSDTDGPPHLYQEHVSLLEDEADKMSLDGEDDSGSSSEAPPGCGRNANHMDEDTGEVTDDEDWANIGAAALRQGSTSSRGGIQPKIPDGSHNSRIHSWDHGGASIAAGASSSSLFQANGLGSDNAQERDAIEALVRLSSI